MLVRPPKVIFWDFDGVICNFLEGFYRWLKENVDNTLEEKDLKKTITSWKWDNWKETKFKWLFSEYADEFLAFDSDSYCSFYPDALKLLVALKDREDIEQYLVSARPLGRESVKSVYRLGRGTDKDPGWGFQMQAFLCGENQTKGKALQQYIRRLRLEEKFPIWVIDDCYINLLLLERSFPEDVSEGKIVLILPKDPDWRWWVERDYRHYCKNSTIVLTSLVSDRIMKLVGAKK